MNVMFVISAFGNPSGAEHVLIDFLKQNRTIQPFILLIGSNPLAKSLFCSVIPDERVYQLAIQSRINSSVSRMLFMPLFRSLLCTKIRRECNIKHLISKYRIQVVYFNNSFETAVFYPLFPGAKKIVHIHDMVNMFRPAHRFCVIKSCKRADQIITVSNAAAAQLVQNGVNDKKITVAYNGMSFLKNAYHEFSSDTLVIGFVGSAIYRKGFDLLFKMANCINIRLKKGETSYRRVKLCIVTNSDPNASYVQELLNSLDDNIEREVLVCVARDVVQKKYREMSFLLVPSRFDPLPTVVLEGIMAGCPVFGSRKDGIPEMLCDDDMMFELNNIDDAMERVFSWLALSSTQRSERMEKMQAYVSSTFTPENKQKCIQGVLDRLS